MTTDNKNQSTTSSNNNNNNNNKDNNNKKEDNNTDNTNNNKEEKKVDNEEEIPQDDEETARKQEQAYQFRHRQQSTGFYSSLPAYIRYPLNILIIAGLGYSLYEAGKFGVIPLFAYNGIDPNAHGFIELSLLMFALKDPWHRSRFVQNEDCINILLTLLQTNLPFSAQAGMGEMLFSDISATIFYQLLTDEFCRLYLIKHVPDLISHLLAVPFRGAPLGGQHALLGIKLILTTKDNNIINDFFNNKKGLFLLAQLATGKQDMVANNAMDCIVGLFESNIFPDVKTLNYPTPRDKNNILFATTNCGALFQEQGRSELSIKAFEQSLKLDDSNSGVRTQFGVEHWKLGVKKNDPKLKEEAMKQYRLALKKDQGMLDAAYHLSWALLSQAGLEPDKKERNNKIISTNNNNTNDKEEQQKKEKVMKEVSALLTHALNLAKQIQKEHDIRQKQFGQAPGGVGVGANQPPIQAPMQMPIIPLICHLLIYSLESQSKSFEALSVAKDWATYFQSDPISHYSYGRLSLDYHDYEIALRELEYAHRLEPEKKETNYKLALCHYKRNNLQKAEHYAKIAIEMEKKQIKKAMKKNNDNKKGTGVVESLSLSYPRLLLARINIRNKKYEEALSYLNDYLLLKPTDINGILLKAICESQLNNNNQSYIDFTNALKSLESIIDRNNGGLGYNKYIKQNNKIAKKLLSIEQACNGISAAAHRKEEGSFKIMCDQYDKIKSLK